MQTPKYSFVFLPGLFAGGWIWQGVTQLLSAHDHQFVVLPAAIPQQFTGEIQQSKLVLAEAVAQCDYPVIFVGNSMGALIALDYVDQRPNSAVGLILSGAPGLTELNVGVALDNIKTGELRWAQQLAETVFYDHNLIPTYGVEEVAALFSNRKIFLNILRWLSFSRRYQLDNVITKLKLPTCLLWGLEDRITPATDWQQLATRHQHLSFHGITACGHSPMLEQPERFVDIMLAYLEQLPQVS